ncbi:hypothetical protein TNCV_2086721 [Trichonephila clavipes]|nr:hypothetical protein TNCV_2086721 [Trichonephila clavipes]
MATGSYMTPIYSRSQKVAAAVLSLPKGKNESFKILREVGLLHDIWQHHLSPPPQFQQETVEGREIFFSHMHP